MGTGNKRNEELMTRAMGCWEGMAAFRRDRERNKMFTYGDQWGDTIPVGGSYMREEDYIRSQGNLPLKNNLIRRLVRNVLGVFRNRWSVPGCLPRDPSEAPEARTMQLLLEYNLDLNSMEEVYARTMEEFLISGLAVHRKWFGRRGGICDCWTDFVSPENFFVDADARDFRHLDVNLVGEIHEMDFPTLAATFSTSAEDRARLASLYGEGGKSRCRVVEVWHREYRPCYYFHDKMRGRWSKAGVSEDLARFGGMRGELRVDEVWICNFLGPGGEVLLSQESPYSHGTHPYVFKGYPFIDGEIHSFVSDIIDQQKFTNRLISMYDWILRASAKGVLLFPEGSLPDGADINDIAEEWSRFNGIILYRPKAGVPLPQQVSSTQGNSGITDLLNIQMKMMEDISGVNGALQGKLENGSVSGTLYSQQTENSMTALADLLRSFDSFIRDATAKDASNIRQFYGKEKIRSIAGKVPGTVTDFRVRGGFRGNMSDFRFTAGRRDAG